MGQGPGTELRVKQKGGGTANPNDPVFWNGFGRFAGAEGWRTSYKIITVNT